MLRRKFYDTLLKWSKEKNQECLLVRGARQIGKTYIIDYFGKNNYKSYIYINFIEKQELREKIPQNGLLREFVNNIFYDEVHFIGNT